MVNRLDWSIEVSSERVTSIVDDAELGAPLSPWTYTNPELFQLEYEMFFLRRWQWVGHTSDVQSAGDYVAADLGHDSVFVIRDKQDALRAFVNTCRHRGSRILSGMGQCPGVIRCPYHGWTYRLDGSLMAIPQEEDFPNVDRSNYGLREVSLEVFHGLLFVRIEGDGPSVSESFAATGVYFEKYGVADYERCFEETSEVWDVNWKVAWDNYLENYHIPIGHPSLHRLLRENGEYDELSSGVSYGTFEIKDKPSNVDEESQYQALFQHGCKRVPEELRGKWVQFGVSGNLGIDLYPEMLDVFQLIPLGPQKTMVRSAYYGHRNPTPEEQELRRLNLLINGPVNDEDRQLCQRVQQGLRTHRYSPGPLSIQESSVYRFHQLVRRLLPVTSLTDEPARGQVAMENSRRS